MDGMFYGIGRRASSWDIGDISQWNTTSVKSITSMFNMAGKRTSVLDLSKWNVSVTERHDSFIDSTQTMVISPKWVVTIQ